MSFDTRSLYELLPAIYRIRDAEHEEPLRALLSVLAEQLQVMEEDLDQLYDDQFIETCAPWAIPYIGDAIGYRPLHGSVPGVRSPRGEVAKTIGLRRHKGTAAMLEVLANEVTGWNARVVEFFQLLAVTQYMKCLRPGNTTPDLRRWKPLEGHGTGFESLAHAADVRRISTGAGRFNIPNIGIFLWRLGAYSQTASRARPWNDDLLSNRFLFSPLGISAQMFTRPEQLGSIDEFDARVGPLNLPMPIGRRPAKVSVDAPNDDYFGAGRSFGIVEYLDLNMNPATWVTPSTISICNLSDLPGGTGVWANLPAIGKIAVDPVLGRIAFGADILAAGVSAMFHRGFSMDLGGGEYDRLESIGSWYPPPAVNAQWGVTHKADGTDPLILQSVALALAEWDAFTHLGVPGFGVIAISNSWSYSDDLTITVPAGFTLAIVAAGWPEDAQGARQVGDLSPIGCFPLISGDVEVRGDGGSGAAGTLIIDGLLISGSLTVTSSTPGLGRLLMNHCTVVPWNKVGLDTVPLPTTDPRIINWDEGCDFEADHCILGSIRSPSSTRFNLTSCIVDATSDTHVAFAGSDGLEPGSTLHMVNTTIIGKLRTREMDLASNCIFLAQLASPDPDWTSPVRAERRQAGCLRFCYVPDGSRLPSYYHCQPDIGLNALAEKRQLKATSDLTPIDRSRELIRLTPTFNSTRYGDPDYAQLSARCAPEIATGADDGSEMGAFHDLFQPQRKRNLQVRLDEYLRFGLEAGIFYET